MWEGRDHDRGMRRGVVGSREFHSEGDLAIVTHHPSSTILTSRAGWKDLGLRNGAINSSMLNLLPDAHDQLQLVIAREDPQSGIGGENEIPIRA